MNTQNITISIEQLTAEIKQLSDNLTSIMGLLAHKYTELGQLKSLETQQTALYKALEQQCVVKFPSFGHSHVVSLSYPKENSTFTRKRPGEIEGIVKNILQNQNGYLFQSDIRKLASAKGESLSPSSLSVALQRMELEGVVTRGTDGRLHLNEFSERSSLPNT